MLDRGVSFSPAVDHERGVAVAKRGLRDQREPTAPVVTIAGEQTHAVALALDDQSISVVLDFMEPVRASWGL